MKYKKGTYNKLRNYWHLLLLSYLLFPGIGSQKVMAQCNTYSNAGNNVDSPPQLCAPHDFQWRTWYTVLGSPATVEMEYNWADGTPPVVVTAVNVGSNRYEAIASHSYPRGGDQCNYMPEVRLRVNGVLCESSIQTQNVTVWDIDSENGGVPRIDPLVYRVCLGNDASVTFDDNSIWNCVPASGENDRINNMARWVQWQYGTGNAGNRIPNVVVGGTPQPFPFDGTVEVLPGPIETSNSTSNTVYVPASTDPDDIGKEFEVTLRNWNLCNPYDSDTLDGNYLNPTSGNLNDGDTAPTETTARIVIVERSDPDFNTRLINASGPITNSFCIGEDIYLQDNTPAITDANFRYEWEIYNDSTGNDLISSPVGRNQTFEGFSTPGYKMIRLTVRDMNSVGNCGGQIVKHINVLSTADAEIAVTDTNGDALGALCYDPANPQPFEVAFEDVSTNFNPATATWTWNFFSHNGSDYVQDSTISGSATQERFVARYTQPGMYMAELVASASGVNCETRDTVFVNVYHQPVAAFTADLVCVGDSTTFTISSNLPQSVNGDQIDLYEWDFDYDGVNFDADYSATSADAFKHQFDAAGTFRVAHRVSTGMGNCSAISEADVNVLSTAIADIAVTETNGDALGTLCYDPANPQPLEVAFEDVSTNFNPATATWTWNFFSHNGSDYVQDSTISGSATQERFVARYTQPGMYMAELVASASGVNCETRDTTFVIVYQKPTAGFTADPLCASDTTVFTSTATLGQSVNGDQINLYEWDFNYDGINFDVDYSTSSANPFPYFLGSAGTYRVAHRVSTNLGSCSALFEQDVEVLPVPDPGFTANQTEGCSPLEVTFSLNTLLASQPAQVDSYEWFIRDLSDNSVSSQLFNPAVDTFAATFVNKLSTFTDHNYEVWVRANASNGCSVESDPQTIRVFSGPSATFSIMNLSGLDANCSPRPYDFRVDAGTRNLNPEQYFWTITDLSDSSIVVDTTLAGNQPLFSYTLTNDTTVRKKYNVRLVAAKAGFCFSSSERIVDVNPLPSAEFTNEIIEADCQLVRYQLKAEQAGVDYTWSVTPLPLNTPDMRQQTIELLYRKSQSGSYPVTVSLQTENLVGCESPLNQQQITVDPQENIGASFTVDPSILEIPDKTVTITNTTNAGDWSYFWDFGDGTTSTEANPGTHSYDTPGEYMIRMRAEGAYCFQEDSALVIIKQTLPQIDFSFSTIEGCLPLEVTFFNQSLYADTASFFWDFGDGNTSTELNPVHTYTESGIYTISLQASNELNVVMKKEIDLVVDLDKGPQADFLIRMAQAYLPGQAVLFSNQSQRGETYFWDFGDGSTSNEENPSHAYEEVGIYEIMLVASNSLGCSDTLRKEIQIEPFHPEVDFTYEPPKGCRPLTVQFRNLSRFVEPGTYRWNFGEGEGVSTQENPVYTYYEPGIYTVTLEASNSAGVTKTSVKEFSVEVYETPRAAFNLRPQEAFLTEPVYFVNLSLGGEKYYWDFGDGNTSTEYEPEHVYEETGIYDVTLVVESNKGCTDTLKLESAVIIKNGGKVNVPNAFTPSTSGPGGTDAQGPNTKNDVFLPVFEGVTKYHLMIYNRWGEMLFETFDKSVGWDGYYKGRLCAKDVYVYKLELQMSNGESRTLVGDVTLIR
ncbi:MAG: PKD domain-containing protein [Cyclobacteriaceae bacterium]